MNRAVAGGYRQRRPKPYAYRFLKIATRIILRSIFRVETEGLESIPRHGPIIFLGNHTSVIDPFIAAVFVPRFIQYVASDSQFRSPFMAFILGLEGTIPKTKAVSDLETVKQIAGVKREGRVIGIFPEGQSGWDGHTLPIVPATDKLVKSLKIPVYVALIQGAFFSWPRWARGLRRGRIVIRYRCIIAKDEARSLSVDEVRDRIRDALEFDSSEYQRSQKTRFASPRRAEYLERALFVCPSCERLFTLHSDRDVLRCRSCGNAVRFGGNTFFRRLEPGSPEPRFRTIRAWNLWQRTVYERWLRERLASAAPSTALLTEDDLEVRTGFKTAKPRVLGRCRVELTPRRLILRLPDEVAIPIEAVEGLNVQNNEHLEFYHHRRMYRLSPVDPRINMYKWDLAIRYVAAERGASA